MRRSKYRNYKTRRVTIPIGLFIKVQFLAERQWKTLLEVVCDALREYLQRHGG